MDSEFRRGLTSVKRDGGSARADPYVWPALDFIILRRSRPSSPPMASINLDEEVRLYTNNTEREKYNLLATLFGIIVALEYLERAYVRDSITAAECAPSSP